jgi:serine/threonine protein kinase
MSAQVACPTCQSELPAAKAGETILCPRCGSSVSAASIAGSSPAAAAMRKTVVAKPLPTATTLGAGATAKPQVAAEKPATDKPPAAKSFGRFKLLSRLGKGAFGAVYRAYDTVLSREVALKVPLARAMESEEARARFLREPKAAAQLRHPHIVPIFDAGFEGQQLYIASAFIEGQTLEKAMQDRPFSLRDAATIIQKLAGALHYAHEQGIVHRDVKPANVMIDSRGEPHLLDFGLARFSEGEEKLTQDGSLMGTPAYMSPEQAGAPVGEVGPASDQYSLCVMLYELLCRALPFQGEPMQVLYQTRESDPPSPRSRNPQVSRDLETICLKGLSKRLTDRYATCGALADDISRFLSDNPISARRVSFPERALRWTKRNPALATAVGLVVLLAVASTLSAIGLQVARHDAETHLAASQQNLEALQREVDARRQAETVVLQREADIKLKEHQLVQKETALQDVSSRLEDVNKSLKVAGEQLTEVTKARDDAMDSALWFVYTKRLQEAQQHLINKREDLASSALDACPEEFRGCEWEWLIARCVRGKSYQWSLDPPAPGQQYRKFFEMSPDGVAVAFVLGDSDAERVETVDARTGRSILKMDPTAANVYMLKGVAFSQRGNGMAIVLGDVHPSGSYTNSLQVFPSALSPSPVRTIRALITSTASEEFFWAAFNRDGSEIMLAKRVIPRSSGKVAPRGTAISCYSVETGQQLWEANHEKVARDCFTQAVRFPDGEETWILGHVDTCRLRTERVRSPAARIARLHISHGFGASLGMPERQCIWCNKIAQRRIAIAPSQQLLVSGVGSVYSMPDSKEVYRFPKPIRPLAFSPDGKRLIAIDVNTSSLVIFDASAQTKEWRTVISFDERLFPSGPLFELSRDAKHAVGVTTDGCLHGWGLAK